MTRYDECLRALNTLQVSSRRHGAPRSAARQRTKEWLTILGVDNSRFQSITFIHIAGTKGKGTTALYCEHLLSQYQQKTESYVKLGCLTSPHVSDVRERIRLNAAPVSKELFVQYFSEVYDRINDASLQTPLLSPEGSRDYPTIPGYPGFLALLGLYIMYKEDVQIAVIETGVGGEHDSTNVIEHPVATGITTLGLDHMNVLGPNLASIAWHKAGIFKKGVPAFTVKQDAEAMKTLEKRALEKGTAGDLTVVSDDAILEYGLSVVPDRLYQRRNAALALALCGICLRTLDPGFTMTKEMASVLQHTQLPGRSEILKDGQRTWLLSAAHNELSMIEASHWFKAVLSLPEHADTPHVLLFGHESWRDKELILKRLHDIVCAEGQRFQQVIFCAHRSGIEDIKPDLADSRIDAPHASKLAKHHAHTWQNLSTQEATVFGTVKEAVMFIQREYASATVLVGGHLYVAGAVRFLLQPTAQ
ncbi:folylpolyglutamate synthase-like protein [Plenodomus tracheiphilus IPT5]|uniref:tetrahydrofolate synthase n=1 Tax=Plenodomus tracheiphilus IPT5 TaxID=1408161 RepID=A0A6A7ARS4_9PLEO|nr:folylpolyglutamate synthase-like protein [Plenodomus tracheiphilus IPT5]